MIHLPLSVDLLHQRLSIHGPAEGLHSSLKSSDLTNCELDLCQLLWTEFIVPSAGKVHVKVKGIASAWQNALQVNYMRTLVRLEYRFVVLQHSSKGLTYGPLLDCRR